MCHLPEFALPRPSVCMYVCATRAHTNNPPDKKFLICQKACQPSSNLGRQHTRVTERRRPGSSATVRAASGLSLYEGCRRKDRSGCRVPIKRGNRNLSSLVSALVLILFFPAASVRSRICALRKERRRTFEETAMTISSFINQVMIQSR